MKMTEQQILNSILAIVEKEFINKNYYGACLPSAMIFWEAAKKLGVEVELKCGTLLYNSGGDNITSNLHFWSVFKEKTFDATLNMMKNLLPGIELDRFSHKANTISCLDPEEATMISVFNTLQATRSTNFYFSKAPFQLRELRNKILKNVNKIS